MLGTVTNAERDVIGQCSQSWLGKALPDLSHRAKFCHWIHGMEEKTNFITEKDPRLQECNKNEQIS